MSLSSVVSIASQGMQAQTTRLSAAANNIANLQSTGYKPQSVQFSSQAPNGVEAHVRDEAGETPDPQEDMLSMVESTESFKLNADVFRTGADLWDVVATMKR